MSTIKFETLVIYDEDDVIDIIHGQHSELLRILKKHDIWDDIAEELSENNIHVESIINIDALIDWQTNDPCGYNTKIKLFINQKYSKP